MQLFDNTANKVISHFGGNSFVGFFSEQMHQSLEIALLWQVGLWSRSWSHKESEVFG